MAEWRKFPEGTIPEVTTAAWYRERERANHLGGDDPHHRNRLRSAADAVLWFLHHRDFTTVGDFGAGDGGLRWHASHMWREEGPPRRVAWWGYDLCPANVWAAREERKVNVKLYDFTRPGARLRFPDLAVMTETLEHLADPHNWLRVLARHCRALVCSSPADERPGASYEGHTWIWDEPGYAQLVERSGWKILTQWRVGPYQLINAEPLDSCD